VSASVHDRVVAEARAWIGTPYRHQASLKGVGCDCLGLLRGVWREVMGAEPAAPPPYSADWAEAGGEDALLRAARLHLAEARRPPRAGDVLLFRWRDGLPAKHCAIATSGGTMVHAHDGACVAEVSFRPWWQRHLAGVFAFPAGAGSTIPR
jgi:NlpC/P60 family putative phage cell wall peptidase